MSAATSRTLRSSSVRSPIKYTGGKAKLVPELLLSLPPSWNTYHEPFVGGGALFWALASADRITRARLSDTNEELVRMYRAVRDWVDGALFRKALPDGLIAHLEAMPYDREFFYEERAKDPKALSDVEAAARFIYLNKTAFNGMHRLNKKGQFNVPFGRYDNPTICDHENLRACSEVLRRPRGAYGYASDADGRIGIDVTDRERAFDVELHVASFDKALGQTEEAYVEGHLGCEPGDLVYADPPYPPLSKTSSFVAYGSERFTWEDHMRLRDVLWDLKKRGVFVVCSNSDQPRVREIYSEDLGFRVRRVECARSINSKASARGNVGELIIT